MRLIDRIREYLRRHNDLATRRDPVWDDAPEYVPTQTMPSVTYQPHGIDTPETLAALREKAEADARAAQESAQTEQWGTWDEPGKPLAPVAATAPDLTPPPPMPPADLSRAMVSQIPSPPANDRNFDWTHKYADYMRRVGVATGTSTNLEHTMAWGMPALPPGDGNGVAL